MDQLLLRYRTLTDEDGSTLNLWQRNMFAVRAEVEVGFAVRDRARFVRLTNGTPDGGGDNETP
ncbi:hypothetical protein H7H51_03430 [Mycolicibacterium farcinogenes]|nr:hypothetical protein [Mycolicibacterium farcinogenes]